MHHAALTAVLLAGMLCCAALCCVNEGTREAHERCSPGPAVTVGRRKPVLPWGSLRAGADVQRGDLAPGAAMVKQGGRAGPATWRALHAAPSLLY